MNRIAILCLAVIAFSFIASEASAVAIYGITDAASGGSYWLNETGGLRSITDDVEAINLKNDFIGIAVKQSKAVCGIPTTFRIYDSATSNLWKSSMYSSPSTWLINNTDFNNTFFVASNSFSCSNYSDFKTYYYDWTSQSWKIWMKSANNATHGVPSFSDNRYMQAFKWKYSFQRIGSQSMSITFLITAHDPFIRIFVDTSNAAGNVTIPIILEQKKDTMMSDVDKNGNGYYFTNSSSTSESILWTAVNLKSGSHGYTFSPLSASGITNSYTTDSSSNNNFIFSLGYTKSQNTTLFDSAKNSIGWSDELLASVTKSTLTYYDIVAWSESIKTTYNIENVSVIFKNVSNDFGIGQRSYFGIFNGSMVSAAEYIGTRTIGNNQHKIYSVSGDVAEFRLGELIKINLTINLLPTKIEPLQEITLTGKAISSTNASKAVANATITIKLANNTYTANTSEAGEFSKTITMPRSLGGFLLEVIASKQDHESAQTSFKINITADPVMTLPTISIDQYIWKNFTLEIKNPYKIDYDNLEFYLVDFSGKFKTYDAPTSLVAGNYTSVLFSIYASDTNQSPKLKITSNQFTYEEPLRVDVTALPIAPSDLDSNLNDLDDEIAKARFMSGEAKKIQSDALAKIKDAKNQYSNENYKTAYDMYKDAEAKFQQAKEENEKFVSMIYTVAAVVAVAVVGIVLFVVFKKYIFKKIKEKKIEKKQAEEEEYERLKIKWRK